MEHEETLPEPALPQPRGTTRTYVMLQVDSSKRIPDLNARIADRAERMDGIELVTVVGHCNEVTSGGLMTVPKGYRLVPIMPPWVVIDGMNESEVAAYDQGSSECIDAVTRILDGTDNGEGANYEPWGTLRRRLIAMRDLASGRLSRTTEASFHKEVKKTLSKRMQGYAMGAFRTIFPNTRDRG